MARAAASNPRSADRIADHAEWLAGTRDWDQALPRFREAARLRQQLLVNDGGEWFATPVPGRETAAPAGALDLSDFYTNPPDQFVYFDEVDGKDITDIPWGLIESGGIRFDTRGAVRLLAKSIAHKAAPFPREAKGIPVRRQVKRLHLLHSVQHVAQEGSIYAVVLATYADGTRKPLPLRFGHHAREIYYGSAKQTTHEGTEVAWQAGQPADKGNPTIYHTVFENPNPDTEIVFLNIESTMSSAAPLVFAISVE